MIIIRPGTKRGFYNKITHKEIQHENQKMMKY